MTTALKNSTAGGRARAKIIEVFGADLRSLAVFRVVLALLVLADLASRATDLYQHYTDAGVLPRTVLMEEVLSPWAFSLNLMNGQAFFQALLFGAAALAALGMLVGYRTRLMTIVVWVLLLSIQWRNPLVGGADGPLLRLLLFWSMFLPLGAYWSVDRALKGAPRRLSTRFLSVATVGLFMQIAFVYWFSAALKSGPEWRVDGTAIYYALSIDQIAKPIGHYLLNFPDLLTLMTFATFGLEAIGPLFLFFPLFTGPVRTAAVLAFMSLHFGIWLTMDIGIFPWISAFCMVCFLPSWFWEKAAKLRAALPGRLEVVRRLQHSAAGLGRAYWEVLRARLPSPTAGAGRSSPASLAAGGDNQPGGSHASAPLTSMAPAAEETQPAEATVQPGTQPTTPTDAKPTMLRSSLATEALAFVFLLYVLCWNLTSVSALTMPERAVSLGPFLGLDQYWGMFAPAPPSQDGWYVIPGTLRDGRKVDVMAVTRDDYRLQEVSWEKPRYVPGTFKNEHWRKYLENIWSEQHADQRLHFGRYICREWNARHAGAEQLMTFQITYMLEETLPDYRRSTPQKIVLSEHSCF
jgi:hypothetical protein